MAGHSCLQYGVQQHALGGLLPSSLTTGSRNTALGTSKPLSLDAFAMREISESTAFLKSVSLHVVATSASDLPCSFAQARTSEKGQVGRLCLIQQTNIPVVAAITHWHDRGTQMRQEHSAVNCRARKSLSRPEVTERRAE